MNKIDLDFEKESELYEKDWGEEKLSIYQNINCISSRVKIK